VTVGVTDNNVTLYEGGAWILWFIAALSLIIVSITDHYDRQKQIAEEYRIKARALESSQDYINAFVGEHPLQKVQKERRLEDGHLSVETGFFGIVANGKISEKICVLFSWEYSDPGLGKIFILDQMPYQDLMVKFENRETPTVEFNHQPFHRRTLSYINEPEVYCDDTYKQDGFITRPLSFLQKYRITAIIRCRPEHWPQDIRLPLNESTKNE
jgi:hypothetical protein